MGYARDAPLKCGGTRTVPPAGTDYESRRVSVPRPLGSGVGCVWGPSGEDDPMAMCWLIWCLTVGYDPRPQYGSRLPTPLLGSRGTDTLMPHDRPRLTPPATKLRPVRGYRNRNEWDTRDTHRSRAVAHRQCHPPQPPSARYPPELTNCKSAFFIRRSN